MLWDQTKTKWTEANTDGLFTVDLMSTVLRHTKGRLRGQLVELRHWQADTICDIKRLGVDGTRMYTTYLLYVARKNSKSLLGAGLAIDGLFDEYGAEVYSAAGSKDQAAIVFKEVAAAVEMDPELSKMFKVYDSTNTKLIECPSTGSIYKALSSETILQEGLNPSLVVFDELHGQPNDELWNVLNQGSDTREAPLTVAITTMGKLTYTDGTPTIAKRMYDYLKKVQSGEVEDLSIGGRIYETVLAKGDDYRDPKHWGGANPALGDFLSERLFADRVRRLPEHDVKTKRLNIWVASSTTWMPDKAFESLGRPRRKPIPDEPAVIALDGSFSQDSTALVAWLLGDDKPHLTLLALWERPEKTPHWTVPVTEVRELLVALFRRKPVKLGGDGAGRSLGNLRWDLKVIHGIVFDPARWLEVFRGLEEERIPVVEFPNSSSRMAPATQLLYRATTAKPGGYTHDGHPALVRHFGNATTKLTQAGTMIDKKNARAHIDLAAAAIMGYDVATQRSTTKPPAQSVNSADAAQSQSGNPFRGHGRLKI